MFVLCLECTLMSRFIFKLIGVSFFNFIKWNGEVIGKESVLFFNHCFVDIFASHSLYSVRNELDSWLIVGV